MKLHTRYLFLFLILLFLINSASAISCPYTRCVNETGWWNASGSFNASATPITAANSNSSPFDTIYVYGGTYLEDLSISKNNLTIIGENRDLVNLTTVTNGITINEGSAIITGLNVTGIIVSYGDYINISQNKINCAAEYDGFYSFGDYITFTSNIINGSSGAYGIYVGSSGYYTSSYGVYANNMITYTSGGVVISDGDYNIFTNNTIRNNEYGVVRANYLKDYYIDIYISDYNVFINGSIDSNSIDFYDMVFTGVFGGHHDYLSEVNFTNRSIYHYHASGLEDNFPAFNITQDGIRLESELHLSTGGGTVDENYWLEFINLAQTNLTYKISAVSMPDFLHFHYLNINGLRPNTSYSILVNDVKQADMTTDSNGILGAFDVSSSSATVSLINYGNFTFTKSNSESQIYQSSQATIISADITDIDGTISSATVEITFNDTKTNYTMTQSGTVWSYSFVSSVPGTYTITNFYATDNSDNTNNSVWDRQFVVVPVSGGGGGGEPTLPEIPSTPTISPTPTTTLPTNITFGGGGGGGGITIPLPEWLPKVIDVRDVASDPIGMMFLYFILLFGLVMVLANLLDGGKVGSLLMGFLVMGISAYALGWLA